MEKYIAVKIVEAEPMSAMLAERTLNRSIYVSNAAQSESGETGHPGYLVQYGGGYRSWCPKKQFEEANRPCDGMTLGLAIEAAKKGLKIARQGWNGKGLSVELQVPDEHSKMTLPYLYMNYPATPASDTAPADHINAHVPWLASQTDMLADDWTLVD